jgi:hypothetical protein
MRNEASVCNIGNVCRFGRNLETKEEFCSRHPQRVSVSVMLEGMMTNIYVQNRSSRERERERERASEPECVWDTNCMHTVSKTSSRVRCRSLHHCQKFTNSIFDIQLEPKFATSQNLLNTQDFCSIWLPTQSMMYPQSCSRQAVILLILQNCLVSNGATRT